MSELSVPQWRVNLDAIIDRSIAIYKWAIMVSFAFVFVGLALNFIGGHDVDTRMASPRELLSQVIHLEASGFLGIGIIVMVLTPVVMILTAAWMFFRAGDRRYSLITLSVATILILSMLIKFVL